MGFTLRRKFIPLLLLAILIHASRALGAETPGPLERMAQAKFGGLGACEQKLVQAVPTGESVFCGTVPRADDPANDPARADQWGHDREVRATLIRWLCADREAKQFIDPRGIQLTGARVLGNLELDFVKVPFRIRIIRSAFTGRIHLMYAEVPELNLSSSRTREIQADELVVPGGVLLMDGFQAEGPVDLKRAKLGAQLNCRGGHFDNPGGFALRADGLRATDVLLYEGFFARGEVNLVRARLSDDLICDGGTFLNAKGDAINADGIAVSEILMREGFRADGLVKLQKARVSGSLDLIGGIFTALDLREAEIGNLKDNEANWPSAGKLLLDGFVYGRIAEGPDDPRTRERWLALQPEFSQQPYEQLAKVLEQEGDYAGGRHVKIEMEDRSLVEGPINDLRWYWRIPAKFWSLVLKVTIGYGYAPWRALYWAIAIVMLGTYLFGKGMRYGVIAPAHEKSESHFPFSAFWYSLDAFLPVVNLRQHDHWVPTAHHVIVWGVRYDEFLRRYLWFHILLGWTITTLFVAGVTGVLKHGL